MKALLSIFCCLALAGTWGFDTEAWLMKRAVLDREAERMQAVYTNCVANLRSPAQNVTVPIEHFPDGSVKASVAAAEAQFFLDSGLIWCRDVCVRQFAQGESEAQAYVKAAHCVIDRKMRCGWAEGEAEVRYSKTVVRGSGIYFSFDEEFVKILSNVRIESQDLKFEGVKL